MLWGNSTAEVAARGRVSYRSLHDAARRDPMLSRLAEAYELAISLLSPLRTVGSQWLLEFPTTRCVQRF